MDIIEDLKRIVKPATLIKRRVKESSPWSSRLFGTPYSEDGDVWPLNPKGRPMRFIAQICDKQLRHENHCQPGMIQLFVKFENFGYMEKDNWHVRYYPKPGKACYVEIDVPAPVQGSWPSSIQTKKILTLPDWEGIGRYSVSIRDMCCTNSDKPWIFYQDAVREATGMPKQKSLFGSTFCGGYPQWVQGESTPSCPICDQPMQLILQIDSTAGLMWGDQGVAYLFRCVEHNEKFDFFVQSH